MIYKHDPLPTEGVTMTVTDVNGKKTKLGVTPKMVQSGDFDCRTDLGFTNI